MKKILTLLALVLFSAVSSATYFGDPLPINHGGTNASIANDALNNLLPDQSTHAGEVLSTDGANTSWVPAATTPTGANNTIAGFDGSGMLYTIPGWSLQTPDMGFLYASFADTVGNRTWLNLSQTNNVSGSLGGISMNFAGDVGSGTGENLNGIVMNHASGTIDGGLNWLTMTNSAPFTGRLNFANLVNSQDGEDYNGVFINNTGNMNNEAHPFQVRDEGDARTKTGVDIILSGNVQDDVQGLRVDVTGQTSNTQPVISLYTQGGQATISSVMTPVSAAFFQAGNDFGMSATVPSGSPLSGTALIMTNLSSNFVAEDDVALDALGLGVIGVASLGQAAFLSGTTTDKYTQYIYGTNIPVTSTGGTVAEFNVMRVFGINGGGGSAAVTNAYGINMGDFDCTPTGITIGNCYGISIPDTTAQNIFGGSVRTNTSFILEDPGVSTNAITLSSPTLAAPYSLVLPVDDGAAGEVLSTDGSGVLSWIPVSGSIPGITNSRELQNTANDTVLDWENGLQYDPANIISIDWFSRTLGNDLGNPAFDWNTSRIYSIAGLQSIDADARTLIDNSGGTSASWQLRRLFDVSGNLSQNWSNRTLLHADGTTVSIAYGAGLMRDSAGNDSISYEVRTLVSSSLVTSVDWGNRTLVNSAAITTLDWEIGEIFDVTGVSSFDASSRRLRNTAGADVFDFTSQQSVYNSSSPTTTKGDLEVHNGTNVVRQAVGTNGQVLTANSATATGVEWTTPTSSAVASSVQIVTGDTTLSFGANTQIFVKSSGSGTDVTLPVCNSGAVGREVTVKRVDGANNQTVIPQGADEIDDVAANSVLTTNLQSLSFMCAASGDWYIF